MKFTKSTIALAVSGFILPMAAQAAVPLLDKASFTLALAIPDTTTKVSFESNAGNEPIDFDRDLGLKTDNVVASVGATWRPWDNHQFGLTYYNNSGAKTKTLADPIEWNGVLYDGTVKAKTNLDSYDVSYIWWAKNEETWALGPRLGLTYMAFESSIDLVADTDGDPVTDSSFNRESNTDVPAPTIGAAWRWLPAENWRVHAEAGYMSATIGDFDGSAMIVSGGVEWFPWENWGFSLNGTRQSIDVNTDQLNFNGDLDLTLSNYNLGITYRF